MKSTFVVAQVYDMVGVQPPDSRRILDTYYDAEYGRLAVYSDKVSFDSSTYIYTCIMLLNFCVETGISFGAVEHRRDHGRVADRQQHAGRDDVRRAAVGGHVQCVAAR